MAGSIQTVIVKIAGRCNLNCSYCYMYNHEDSTYLQRPRFMADDVFDAMLDRMDAYCKEVTGRTLSLVFHGGEPTLMPVDRFESMAVRAGRVLGDRLRSMSIQTNATLLNERWVEVFRRHRIAVGVSLDGPEEVHDSCRVDFRGRGSYRRTMSGIDTLRRGGINPNVLCVVAPGSSGLDVYRHFRDAGITWMSFLLPDVSHDSKEVFYPDAGATPVADYLVPIFDEWVREDDPGVVVGIFWDLLQRELGGPGLSDAFGNPLMTYVVVESDGAIEALDALRVCDRGMTSSGFSVLEHSFDDIVAVPTSLLAQALTAGFPLADECRRCRIRATCGGGYLPHRYSRRAGFDNPSVWCSDILALVDHVAEWAAATTPDSAEAWCSV